MYIEQIYTKCLAQASYYIESDGIAAVVDPIRDVNVYLEIASKRNASIRYVLNTHFHADFVSGQQELYRKAHSLIVFGPEARPLYSALIASDHEKLILGKCYFEVLHTPGHTIESTCFLLHDEKAKPHALFSGDTLFVGDVGRPDLLSGNLSKETLAEMLYDSIHNKIKNLADDILLYPGHGAGSACGKNLGKETYSTIGEQRKFNYAFSDMSKEKFVALITSGQPAIPAYFFADAAMNKKGSGPLEDVVSKGSKSLSAEEVNQELGKNTMIIDTRNASVFGEQFIKGSVNIGLDGQFAIWFGTLINMQQLVMVVCDKGKEQEVLVRLARIGFENVIGLIGDETFETLVNTGYGDSIGTIEIDDVLAEFNNVTFRFLDVRAMEEAKKERVHNAIIIPLDELQNKMEALDIRETYMIYCAGGYRSMIAASLLKRKGFYSVYNIKGGMKRIKEIASDKIDVLQS